MSFLNAREIREFRFSIASEDNYCSRCAKSSSDLAKWSIPPMNMFLMCALAPIAWPSVTLNRVKQMLCPGIKQHSIRLIPSE
jgi:hypothetical protein